MPVLKPNDTSISNNENILEENIKTCNCKEHCVCSVNIENIVEDLGTTVPYICKTCGKCFKKYKNLYRHEKIHEDKKQYLCATCGRLFTIIYSIVLYMYLAMGEGRGLGRLYNISYSIVLGAWFR